MAKRIIIAEDYDVIRKMIVDYINDKHPKIETEAFESCEEAFERMKNRNINGELPDLVLTNYMNRGRLNGLQFTEKIRRELSKDVLIYVMSGNGVEKEALEAGANGYVTKPFDLAALDFLVRRLQPTQ